MDGYSIRELAGAVSSICACETRDELKIALGESLALFGFQRFGISLRKKQLQQLMTAPTMTTWTDEDQRSYHEEGWLDRDPDLASIATSRAPMAWHPRTWSERGEYAFSRFVEEAGILGGVTVRLDERPGTWSAISAASLAGAPPTIEDAYLVQLLANVAVTRAAGIGIDGADVQGASEVASRLSARQIEIMEWAVQGKSNGDIATIIGQTKRAVEYHMTQIIRKFEVASKAQAVAIFSIHMSNRC